VEIWFRESKICQSPQVESESFKSFLPVPNFTSWEIEKMGVEDGAQQQQQQYDLSANWGNILFLVCSLPMVGLMFLNPISLFLGGCALFWAVVLTFVPKLLYFVLLEYYISCGR